MALTNADIHTFVTAPALPADKPTQSLGTAISVARDRATSADAKADALAAKVDALTAAVAALHVGGVDMDALSTAVADKLAARLQS